MSEDNKDDKYVGPGKITSAVGRGLTEAAVIGAVGAAAGAAIGAAFKSPGIAKDLTLGARLAGSATQYTERGASMVMGTGAGAIVGGAVGGLHGLYRGVVNSGNAKTQVEKLVEQRNGARHDGEVVKHELEGAKHELEAAKHEIAKQRAHAEKPHVEKSHEDKTHVERLAENNHPAGHSRA